MITIKDLFEISGNKMMNDIQKSFIRRTCTPDVAEEKCAIIDVHEKVDHFQRFVREYSEWLLNLQRIPTYVLQNLVYCHQY